MTAIIDGTNSSTFPADASINGLTVGKGGGSVANNTVVGNGALAATSGGQCTAIGNSALASNTATNNTAVGTQALTANTSGVNNDAFGYAALYTNTTGTYNTAIGGYNASSKSALFSNTTGSYNIAVGNGALQANTTASNNTAVGYQAGYSNTTGSSSTIVGYQAGYASTGNTNCSIGFQAGYNSSGSSNTFVGPNSAGGAMTSGSKNTILGGYTGNQGGLDIRTSSNRIVLSDGDGNPRNYIDDSGYNYLLGSGGGRIYFRDTSNTAQYSIQSTSSIFYIFSASNYAYLSGTGFSSWSFASDARIKENIVDLEYGLSAVMALKPRRFDYISNKHQDIGFIAQEVKSVVPEAVTGEEIEFDENDTQQERAEKTMGVSKELLIPVLVKAVQELKAIVDSQAVEIAELKGKA